MTPTHEADPRAVQQAEGDRRATLAELDRILADPTLAGSDRTDLENARDTIRDGTAFCVHPSRLALYLGYRVMVGTLPEILSGVRYIRSDNSAARLYSANTENGDRCFGTAYEPVTVYGPPVPLATAHTDDDDMSNGPSWTAYDNHDERVRMLAARWRVSSARVEAGMSRIVLFLMLATGPYEVDADAADAAGSVADHLHPEATRKATVGDGGELTQYEADLDMVLALTRDGQWLELDEATVMAAAEPLLTAARDQIIAVFPTGHPAQMILAGDVWTTDFGQALRELSLDPRSFRAVATLDWAIGHAKGEARRLSRVVEMTAMIPEILVQDAPSGPEVDATRLVWVWPHDDAIDTGTAQELADSLAAADLGGQPMPEHVYAAYDGEMVEVFPRIQAGEYGSVDDDADYATHTMMVALPRGGIVGATWVVDGRT